MSATTAPLRTGSHVFVPKTGVATVVGRETKSFGETSQDFYVLELSRGASMYLPVDGLERAGVRKLVTKPVALSLMERIESTTPAVQTSEPHRDRTARYEAAVASGCAERYTEALRELIHRAQSSKLSARDQSLLDTVRDYFVTEMAAALDRPTEELETMLLGIRSSPE